MTDIEFAKADKELFAVVNGKKPTDDKTVGFNVPVNRIRTLMPIFCSALVAGIFFAAAILGWMDMIFGTVVTLAATVRAIALYWRYRHGRK